MTFPVFLELVEAKTKLASILPFGLGVVFAWTYFHQVDGLNTVIFFVAMLLFDMMTTALNNLMDYQKAQSMQYQRQTNIIGRAHLEPRVVKTVIVALLVSATLLGLLLVYRTDWVLLLLGMACFAIGIFYTFGPLPLSRLPLGELFSGVVMGLGIPAIAVYVNVTPARFVSLQLAWPTLTLAGDIWAIIALGLTCVTPMATIANVMLANNLSDLEEDQRNHRHTLPMYLSHQTAIYLYAGLAYVGYIAMTVAVIIRGLPVTSLLMWFTFPLVVRHVHQFRDRQDKAVTFVTAVRNLLLTNGSLLVGMGLGAFVG